jgi:hypothetical protein
MPVIGYINLKVLTKVLARGKIRRYSTAQRR